MVDVMQVDVESKKGVNDKKVSERKMCSDVKMFYKGKEELKIWASRKYMNVVQGSTAKDSMIALQSAGIDEVIVYDEISTDWDDWYSEDKVQLVVFPIISVIDQNGANTVQKMKRYGYTDKIIELSMPIDVVSHEHLREDDYCVYFPTRNIVVSKVNPFHQWEFFMKFVSSLKNVNVKFMKKEDRWKMILDTHWKLDIDNRIKNLKKNIETNKKNILSYNRSTVNAYRDIQVDNKGVLSLENFRDNAYDKMLAQIEDIKKLPFVKDVQLKDSLYVDFGPIYITDSVKVGEKKKSGTRVPLTGERKVFIGFLKFAISGDDINVVNAIPNMRHHHPHANDSMCLGSESHRAMSLLASLDFKGLCMFLYSWATSFNSGDAMMSVQMFYDAQERYDKFEYKDKKDEKTYVCEYVESSNNKEVVIKEK